MARRVAITEHTLFSGTVHSVSGSRRQRAYATAAAAKRVADAANERAAWDRFLQLWKGMGHALRPSKRKDPPDAPWRSAWAHYYAQERKAGRV